MTVIEVPAMISLRYHVDAENDAGEHAARWMADPAHTNELLIEAYPDDGSDAHDALSRLGRLQIQLCGTPRALEEFGRYLIGLARLESHDTNLHDHFEDVEYQRGGTVHLIVRRLPGPAPERPGPGAPVP